MDHSQPPASPTWLPSARPQGKPATSKFRTFSPRSFPSTSRSPTGSRPLSSSTHLLQDLEPRTYDSPSDVDSVPSEYKDSPPPPTGAISREKDIEQLTPRRGRSIPAKIITPRSKPRWARMQQYTDHYPEDEQHTMDSSQQSISRRRSRQEDELPRWARDTDTGRIEREEEDEVLESMQPEWMRSSTFSRPSQDNNKVQFSIPPPITASFMLPPIFDGSKPNGQRSIMSSIFGAFPGKGRSEGRDEGSIGRNRTSRLGEEWVEILRQDRLLQRRIQELLDLQASGLQQASNAAGGASNQSSNVVDLRPSTRTRSHVNEGSMHSVSLLSSTALNVRHGVAGNRALHYARMELLKAMYTLYDLAIAKEAVLAETSQSLEGAHKQVLAWRRKLSVADRNLQELEMGHATKAQEAGIDRKIRDVDTQIDHLETRLKEAKERRAMLLRKKVEGRSVKEAEAAKWVEVKREIDGDVGRWLRDPNIPSDMLTKESYRNERWEEFMKSNPQRRNLEVAVEGLAGAIIGMGERTAAVQAEVEVCGRGAQIWSECLELIMKSEKALKEFLQKIVCGKDNLRKEMLELMNDTERKLTEKLRICSHEGWNLLVACLSAEVEAWREGIEVLGKMMERSEEATQHARREHLDLEPSNTSHSDEEAMRQRRHSGNTNSTEDPMWGSGLDNDARILEDPSSVLSRQDLKLLQAETIPVFSPANQRKFGRHSDGTGNEIDDHVIFTEGLNISPSHSPWIDSSPKKGSSSPDREVSFRTAMEHSIQVETEHDTSNEQKNEAKGHETAEMKREDRDQIEHEMPTLREQKVPPHSRKGVKIDGEGEESDGEVPADLLG